MRRTGNYGSMEDPDFKIPRMESIENSEISEWYRDKTVFLTGGTGFMGKVLVEKLLRSCPVKKIFLLVRPKKGADIRQRIDDMLNYKLFDKLKANRPEFLDKLYPVRGDITMEGLGLSEEDEAKLAAEVHVVFHVAATINFQEPIRVAVSMNMLGTKRVVNLAKKMSKLEALVHVSTAYCNCHLQETYEELYPAPLDPARLIQLTEWFDDDILESITPQLVAPRPNTYTFTKALAEHILVNDAEGRIPFSIIRPSIVCGAWREPEPGWVDNMFAFTGLLVGMGKGVLRTLYIKQGIKLDFIPVDVPINLMIVAAYNTAKKKFVTDSGIPIFCCSTGYQQPLTIEDLNDHLKDTVRVIPQEHPIWFPDGSAKTNKTLHTIHLYIANVIPAYIADFICKILGKKQIAVKLCNKMTKAINALEYFMLRDWTFHNENVQGLWAALSPADQQMFHFNVGDLDWGHYIDRYQRGCKKFILKESTSDEALERAHKNMNKMLWVHRILQFVLMYCAWCLVSSDISVTCLSTLFNELVKWFALYPLDTIDDNSSAPSTPALPEEGLLSS
ncbi:Male sterility NAD-binding [Trinorchestia longiramus]|nr:Male sterility NAD-binding [Trinorchestia longiramus]